MLSPGPRAATTNAPGPIALAPGRSRLQAARAGAAGSAISCRNHGSQRLFQNRRPQIRPSVPLMLTMMWPRSCESALGALVSVPAGDSHGSHLPASRNLHHRAVIGVQSVRVFSAEGRPGPLPLGTVVDIRARVESIGPGAYRTTECLGGAACPAILMVPGAVTQARLNAAQVGNTLVAIHGMISSFQAGGTPVISVSSVTTAAPTAGGPGVFVSQFAACLSRCLQSQANVLVNPATIAARLVLCGLASGVGALLTTPLTIPQTALVCLAAGLSVDATLLAACIGECLGRG